MSQESPAAERDVSDSVLNELYDAAAGISDWPHALHGLSCEMQTSGIQLVVVDKHEGRLLRSEQPASGYDEPMLDGILEHVREWHRHDPHMALTATLPVGTVMNTAVSFPIEQYTTHPFYREYWSAYGVHTLLAAKLAEDERDMIMVAVARRHPRPMFSSNELRLFDKYVSHLTRALRIARHLDTRQTEVAAGLSLIRRF